LAKSKPNTSNPELGDSMSILRFVRGNKSKRLEISSSGKYCVDIMRDFQEIFENVIKDGNHVFFIGLTLKYHKMSSSSKNDKDKQEGKDVEELVLTNMAFSSGLHLWEIIAPISCNSMCKFPLKLQCL
jgi:hypothetical protein